MISSGFFKGPKLLPIRLQEALVEGLHRAYTRFLRGFDRCSLSLLLGGSWVVICGVISPLTWVIINSTHEPPSTAFLGLF